MTLPVNPDGSPVDYTSTASIIAAQERSLETRLLSGQAQYKDLSPSDQSVFNKFLQREDSVFTPGTPYKPEAIDALSQQLTAQYGKNGQKAQLPGWLHPLEWAGSKMYQFYSNYISKPISFAFLTAREDIQDILGISNETSSFSELWGTAEHMSPGQSLRIMFNTKEELKKEHGFDLDLVDEGKANKSFFKKGWTKYSTGVTDLAVAWYADPLVLGLRGIGQARQLTYAKPVAGRNVDKIVSSPTVNSMLKLVEKAKVGRTTDEAAAHLNKTVPSFMDSKNGSGYDLANALVRAENADEARLVLSVSIGDPKAIEALGKSNASLDVQLRSLAQKKTSIKSRWDLLKQQPYARKRDLAAAEKDFNQTVEQMAKIYDTRLRNLDTLEGAQTLSKLNYNRVTTPIGAKMRGGFYGMDINYARPATKGGDPMLYQSGAGRAPAAMRLFYNSTFVYPMRVARGFVDAKPQSYIDLNAADSFRGVEAALRDTPGLTRAQRGDMVGRYRSAAVAERPAVLNKIEQEAITAMAERRGLTASTARAMYNHVNTMRGRATEGSLYTTVRTGDRDLNVVEVGPNGEFVTREPLLASQMADSHVMIDLQRMDRILKRSGSAIQRLINEQPNLLDNVANNIAIAGDKAGSIAEAMNSLWKFGQLARIGYGPRAITDELVGQTVAVGVFSMMGRTAQGAKTVGVRTLEKFFNGNWQHSLNQADELLIAQYDNWIDDLHKEIGGLEEQLTALNNATPSAGNAALASQVGAKVAGAKAELANMRADKAGVINRRASSVERQSTVEGRPFSAPYEGQQGAMFRNMNSATTTMENQIGAVNGSVLRMNRPNGWTSITADPQNPARHLDAWHRDLQHQIGNDALALERVKGKTIDEMEAWLKTDAGKAYSKEAPRQMLTPRQRAEDVSAHVDAYLRTVDNPVIRQAIVDGKLTTKMLDEASPTIAMRPDVHGEQLSATLAKGGAAGEIARVLDGTIAGFYKVMNQLPAEHLSRNPLFAQLYKSHLRDISKTWDANGGATHLSGKEYEMFESAARKRAITDVKRLTFNMDYQTRSVYALRFMAPFFGATMESWTRWSRIIADKPQTVAGAVNLYNAPMRTGIATTYDGDHIGGDGYATNSLTGERYKVAKGDVYINVPIPGGMKKMVAKAMGVESDKLVIPLNSLNLVLQGEPIFNPGLGPVVQIPANEFATGGSLGPMEWEGQYEYADLLKETGILPFGVTSDSSDMIVPAWARRFFNAEDESSAQYRSAFLGIMQNEYWRATNGQRDDMPTMKEIRDKARKFTFFKATVNYILPFSADFTNPTQLYADEFKKIQASGVRDPDKAFLDKYGDSMWMFMAAMSKSNLGLPASNQGVGTQKGFQDLIDTLDDPKLSALLTDQFASKGFNQGAYIYQLNHPAQTGSDVMGREKVSPREALEQAQEAQGWYLYNKDMLALQAELFDRGLTSFSDKGAADLLNRKQAMIATMSDPEFQGEANPYYNKAWSEAFNVIDPLKMDRRIADMRKIVQNPVAITMANEGMRSDFASLAQYIDFRDEVNAELAKRGATVKGSSSILAKKNADLRHSMTLFTNRLIENDTRFNELHNRYLGKDMGYDETLMGDE